MSAVYIQAEINRLKQIVKEAISSPASSSQLYHRIEQLEKKIKNNILYVAVAGEFNSGKSTFINALLRERLLKEAVTPTTAAATYIKRSRVTGILSLFKRPKNTVSVCFDSGDSFLFNETSTSDIVSFLAQEYDIRSSNDRTIKDIIGILTAEQSVSRHITQIELQLTNEVIPDNFYIVDTPGFNPGATSFDNHMSIARSVVSEVADMAILLMPANQAMSNSLSSFLQEPSIARYLHRCIFVVTKIDCIERFERNSVINYVTQNLKALGVKKPRIYTTSAWCMLPVNRVPLSLADEWEQFQRSFVEMETELWQMVADYRDVAIYEHCLNILYDISQEITEEINRHIMELKESLRVLQNNTIKRIQELTDAEFNRAAIEVKGFFSSLSVSPASYISRAESRINSIIRSGGKLRHFRSVELPKIQEVVKEYTQDYISHINNQLQNSLGVFNTQVNHFKQVFHTHYQDMPALEPKLDYSSQKKVSANASYNPSANDAVSRLGGVRHFFGSIFNSESDIQNGAIKEVNSTVSSYLYELSNKVSSEKDKIRNAQIAILKRYCDRHVSTYGKRVEKLIKAQNQEKEALSNRISFLRTIINEIAIMSNRVEQEFSKSVAS